MSMQSDIERVRLYHDATKHRFERMSRSAGYLDWVTQPNPFRSFGGAELIDLVRPLASASHGPADWTTVGYDSLFRGAPAVALVPGLGAVSVFLRFSLGLSAWKEYQSSRWPLRVNPSSGNLHPSEGYVVLGPGVAGSSPGVFHYRPDQHAIERRSAATAEAWAALARNWPDGSFCAAITSVHWREAWKYGERAFRYCQHDTGHAIAAMRLSAALMGWHAQVVPDWHTADLATLLGANRDDDFEDAEYEEPECLLLLSPAPVRHIQSADAADVAAAFGRAVWSGRANRLSADHHPWPAIDDVAEATRGALAPPSGKPGQGSWPAAPDVSRPSSPAPAASRLFLQRRSATDMTGEGELDLDTFCFLLRRVLPGDLPPWDALPWEPRVHLALFVHRIRGLDPGLYVFVRSAGAMPVLQQSLRQDFAWARPPGVPEDLPLFLLVPLDVRRMAEVLSCRQAIAADGFFSTGMIAEFDAALATHGASSYRRLFWEAGAIGHMLYLEAEAAGARGTGIGCYFDDAVHDVFGITDHGLQSLYHFTVGLPIEDTRLRSEPGYRWEALLR
jgi:SagB-type dehydrogenase family enzyme